MRIRPNEAGETMSVGAMMGVSGRRLWVEVGVLYVIVFVLTYLNNTLVDGSLALKVTYSCSLLACIAGPWLACRFVNRRSREEAGAEIFLSASDAGKGLLVLAALVVPVCLGAYVWFTQIQHWRLAWMSVDFGRSREVLELVCTQVMLVALPEEFFYRGYVLTTLKEAAQKVSPRWSEPAFWGLSRGAWIALVISSALFALCHIFTGGVARLVTFFPGMLFGLLRLKSEGILGCVLLHAGCNLLMALITANFVI